MSLSGGPRLLFVTQLFTGEGCIDSACTPPDLFLSLAQRGFRAEAICGAVSDTSPEVDPSARLAEQGQGLGLVENQPWTIASPGVQLAAPSLVHMEDRGVPITAVLVPPAEPDEIGITLRRAFVPVFADTLARFRPDAVVLHGVHPLTADLLAAARKANAASVVWLDDLLTAPAPALRQADAVLVPTRFAAGYHRDFLGLDCRVLPPLVDPERLAAERAEARFVTFVDPTPAHGAFVFARLADVLGWRRPDIPLLVIEGEGTEATLAECGLDLTRHGNVHLSAPPDDPRQFWAVTRLCLVPDPGGDTPPPAAIAALAHGIPVLGSDRGAVPETLGAAGTVLPIPRRLTAATRLLPTVEEVEPWIAAILRLWDEAPSREEQSARALAEARRWSPEVVVPQFAELFEELRSRPRGSRAADEPADSAPAPVVPASRSTMVVLVPHLGGIEPECEQGLLALQRAGVRVVRLPGSSAIDVARNALASDALHDGFETLLFIDSDIGFDPNDALRLLARPEPVLAGIYAKKGQRELTSRFLEGIATVVFGREAGGLYPLQYAATGFLRIRAEVLRRMIAELALPLCNTQWGRGIWPFFQPLLIPRAEGGFHYLGEDWSFSHRLEQIGVTPLADTTIRLWHYGRYGYGWEDAGSPCQRFGSYTYHIQEP